MKNQNAPPFFPGESNRSIAVLMPLFCSRMPMKMPKFCYVMIEWIESEVVMKLSCLVFCVKRGESRGMFLD